MNLENVKTVHDVLVECINISTNIERAAFSLAESDFCPGAKCRAWCRAWCSCVECWKHWLESKVSTNDHA